MELPTYDVDNLFEDVYIYGKLNYDFDNDDITVKSINVTSPSIFTGDVTFSGDITLDEITCRNANVTGVATVGTGLYLDGKLFDGDGDFGTAGQILSSDGTDLNWIDANTTSVANANNVGTNADSTNASQFITFVSADSGNNPIRVDSELRYNPNTNSAVIGGDTPATAGQTQLTLRSNSQVGLSLLCGAIQNATITFGGVADGYSSGASGYDDGAIMYDNSNNHMQFDTAGGERLRIGDSGQIGLSGANYGTSGQFLKSTGGSSAPVWDDVFSGDYNDLSNKPSLFSGNYNDLSNLPTIPSNLIAQARSAIDTSTSTQFNPIGYVDKLTLTLSNVQSTSKILLFFRMTLQHSGSGETLGRVTGPSLFGGDTQFEVASNPGSRTFSGVLFDASSSTSREFKIQYADNGGVSSAILNTELFAVEIKLSS